MGKKYLETKKDSLESSILGVWQNAIEEGDAREAAARMDGRTRGYKSHRAKLEAARTRREEKKKLNVGLDEAKGYLELEFKDKQAAENAYSQINNKILPGGNPPYEDFNQEGNTLQFDTRDKNQTKNLMKELQSGGLKGFKVAVQEEIEFDIEELVWIEEQLLKMSEEEFDIFVEDLDDELLDGVEMILDETIALNEKGGLLKKIGGAIAARIPGTQRHSKRIIKKAADRKQQRDTKAQAVKAKQYLKKKKKASVFGAEFNPLDEKHDTHGQMAEASGDKEAYKKFFDAALKKFKVSSPAEFKSDEEKKKFFDYIDKNWTGDHEESINHVKEFKIQSMKDALAKVWDVGEGHNPFKKEDDEKKVKKNKTETGKEPATVDLKPKIDD